MRPLPKPSCICVVQVECTLRVGIICRWTCSGHCSISSHHHLGSLSSQVHNRGLLFPGNWEYGLGASQSQAGAIDFNAASVAALGTLDQSGLRFNPDGRPD